MTDAPVAAKQKGFLGFVERAGNKLPDPVFLFFYLILILIGISVACAVLGVSAIHPTQTAEDGTPVIISAASLLSPENLQRVQNTCSVMVSARGGVLRKPNTFRSRSSRSENIFRPASVAATRRSCAK